MLKMETTAKPIEVLIVDDHPIMRVGIAAMIAKCKEMKVVGFAASGEEAIEKFAKHRPDIVLLDLRLPGMSGVELLERVREIRPNSVAILISGYSDVLAFTAAINLSNVRGFIPKPWDLEALRTKLEEAVFQYREMARGFNE